MIATALAPSISSKFQKQLKKIDPYLRVSFNCATERFEIYRWSNGGWHWIIAVENADESFRPLDNRIFKKLHQMDIIKRWGSVANYEKHLDEKLQNWKDEKQAKMDYEIKCDLKNDRKLWQKAADNFRSGIVNDPPDKRNKKVISYSKGAL